MMVLCEPKHVGSDFIILNILITKDFIICVHYLDNKVFDYHYAFQSHTHTHTHTMIIANAFNLFILTTSFGRIVPCPDSINVVLSQSDQNRKVYK